MKTLGKKYFHGMLMAHGVLKLGYYDEGAKFVTFTKLADLFNIIDEKEREGFFYVLGNEVTECELDEAGLIASVNDGKGIVGVGFY